MKVVIEKMVKLTIVILFVCNLGLIINTQKNIENTSSIQLEIDGINYHKENTQVEINYTINTLPTQTEIEDFFDDIIPNQLDEYNCAGMTLSVVKDNETIFSKGYGYASLLLSKPVIANQTLFRIGSITKTFTAVAVLQLVEDGLLDFDANVNDYLTAFKIPDTYSEPITLKDLLTHSAGFEEKIYPSIIAYSSGMISLEQYLIESLPDRVHAPGEITSYSNYGLTLAGYIVQKVSGTSIEEYFENEILHPLGMLNSSLRQPLPSNLLGNMSIGYDQYLISKPFEYVLVSPAGALSSTAYDMSKFMIALLNNGTYNGTQILTEESIQLMLENQFITNENLPGVNFGTYDMDLNNVHIIGHGGDTAFFHSRMALFPEMNFGIFASYNSQNASLARTILFNEFISRFFQWEKQDIEPMKGYSRGLHKFNGVYMTTRRQYSDKDVQTRYYHFIIKEEEYFQDAFEVTTRGRYLRLSILNVNFIKVAPNYFVEASGEYDLRIAFSTNTKGSVTAIYANFLHPTVPYEKLYPIISTINPLNIMFFVVCFVFLVVNCIWGVNGIIRIVREKSKPILLPILAKFTSFGVLIFASLTFGLFYYTAYVNVILQSEGLSNFGGLITVPIFGLVFIAGMFVFTPLSWTGIGNSEKKLYWKLWERILFSVLTGLSSIIIVCFVLWQLLG